MKICNRMFSTNHTACFNMLIYPYNSPFLKRHVQFLPEQIVL